LTDQSVDELQEFNHEEIGVLEKESNLRKMFERQAQEALYFGNTPSSYMRKTDISYDETLSS